MKYRLLRPKEHGLLKPLADKHPNLPVGPEYGTAAAVVAETDSGELAGVLFLQLAWHMEPLVLTGKGRPHPVEMAKLLEDFLAAQFPGASYYSFSDSEPVDHICRANGMSRAYNGVYIKQAGGAPCRSSHHSSPQ